MVADAVVLVVVVLVVATAAATVVMVAVASGFFQRAESQEGSIMRRTDPAASVVGRWP